jgi:flagellar basal body-associated protein FliL
LAIVVAMPEDESDPIANTQMFRRFAQAPDPAAGKRGTTPLVIVLVLLALVLAGIVIWLAAR